MRRVALLVLVVLVLPACRSDRVPLSYRLETGRLTEHHLSLRAEVTRTLQGQTRQQDVEATFRATQEILGPLEGGGAGATITLTPESLEVDGRPVDVGSEQRFVVHLGADGRIVSLQAAAGGQTEALDPVAIERLLPRLRPVLPGRSVSPGDTWRARTRFSDEQGLFSLATTSRLEQLGITDGHEAALVRTSYESPVDRTEQFATALADVRGEDLGVQEAWFALDGLLVRATSDSVGAYRVTFRPPGGDVGLAPVHGSLVVRLHTEMRLLSAA